MKKVILVSGYVGGPRDMLVLKHTLKKFKIIYFPYLTNLKESIEKIANQLNKFVNNLKLRKGEKISIVALSSGGLVVDYYLKFLNNKKVDKFISLCSPFKGTYLAHLSPKNSKGLQQLKINSNFLDKLARKKLKNIKVENVWCWFDIICPGTSAKGINSKHTYFFLHYPLQYWPPIINEVKRFLKE